jgi:hypothetical protein
MRLVTWNCLYGPAPAKAALLAPLQPDVVVLQECGRPQAPPPGACVWSGALEHKGIAVLARPPFGLLQGPPAAEDGATSSFLACSVTGPTSFRLLAVWAHPRPDYVADLWDGLDQYGTWLREGETVVAGDFNSSRVWDQPGAPRTHAMLEVRLREEFGLVNAWRAVHPDEPEPATYYQRYLEQHRPFHIDYCFIPEAWTARVRAVSIGSFTDYQAESDHRPLMVEIEL